MTEPMKYYYLKTKDKDHHVSAAFFTDGAHPLLWMNQGFFSLIPRETIANFLSYANDMTIAGKANATLGLLYSESLGLDTPLGRALSPDEDFQQPPGDQHNHRKLNGPVAGEVPT